MTSTEGAESRRTLARRAALGAGLLVGVWVVATAVVVALAWGRIDVAERELAEARAHLASADLRAARDAIGSADAALAGASRWLGLPTTRLAVAVPGIGTSIGVSRDLATAVRDVTTTAAGALDALLGDDDGASSLRPRDGRIPVAAIAELEPPLDRAADALAHAVTVAREAPTGGLARPVADARDRLLRVLPDAAVQARNAARIAEHLPIFLGAGGSRRYLLAAANPAEQRGTGGYIGAVAVVTFTDGEFEPGDFTPTYDLPPVDPDELPPPTPDQERYTPFGGTAFWQNLNLTPDAPTAAEGFERLWAATHDEPVDGTIIVDPFALETLLDLTGPVTVPGIDETLDAQNVVSFVSNEAYARFDEQDVRQQVLGSAAAVALRSLLSDPPEDALVLARDLGQLLADRHLIVHAADPDIQAVFEDVGIAGRLLDPVGDFIAVILNSATGSKVDFWARRNLTYDVRLLEDGGAEGHLEVTITNDAPPHGVPRVVGPNAPGLEAGDNLLFVSTYCATSCSIEGGPASVSGRDSRLSAELGHPVWGSWHLIPSRDETTVSYRWRTDEAWRVEEGLIRYRLTYQHQPMVRGTNVTVRLALPESSSVVELPRNATVADGVLTWQGFQRGDAVLEVALRPDGS
ncbi:MAG: DUF4012 domain-containing protein [Actinobacteria bacterium]|nr:DUF4012 domain-containing protein [Actinomycetota bacterium]